MHAPAFFNQPNPTPLALALSPLAALYGAAARFHGQKRAKAAYYAGVPVIGVGNIVMGGSGKTPLTMALAQHYANQGLQVAIVLKGYKGTESRLPLQVRPEHTATQVGDEAFMLAQSLPRHVQVWVGQHRPSVVRRAEQAGARLILLDDAFQRRDVARQANILVLHGPHPFGNSLCLPAGPLREPLEGRTRADFAIHFNAPPLAPHEAPPYYGLTTYRLTLASAAADMAPLKGKPIVAFAGIGHPEKFFEALRAGGLTLAHTVPLPDHAAYTPKRLAHLQALARQHGATLVTTAKDASKLPAGFAAVVKAEVQGPDWENITQALDALLR